MLRNTGVGSLRLASHWEWKHRGPPLLHPQDDFRSHREHIRKRALHWFCEITCLEESFHIMRDSLCNLLIWRHFLYIHIKLGVYLRQNRLDFSFCDASKLLLVGSLSLPVWQSVVIMDVKGKLQTNKATWRTYTPQNKKSEGQKQEFEKDTSWGLRRQTIDSIRKWFYWNNATN